MFRLRVLKRKRWSLACSLCLLSLLLAACASGQTPAPSAAPVGAAIPVAEQATATLHAATAAPSPVPAATLLPTPTPAPTVRPSATPVPAPSLKQLTQGKCCTQPFWSADSSSIYYIDKPDANSPTGFYSVDVATAGPPQLVSEHITFFSSDLQFALSYDPVNATIERLSDGQKWQIRNGGRSVLLSPDHTRVVWSETGQTGPLESRVSNVMLANLDGSGARSLGTALRGGASAWLDNDRLLMTARPDRTSQVVRLSVFTISSGAFQTLAMSDHLRGTLPSPDGSWVAYTIVFDKDPAKNGLWLIPTAGGTARRMDFYGSFQWRDGHRLVYVPLLPDSPVHAFYEYDTATGIQRRLTGPAEPAFKIANGDWIISPDGHKIVFLATQDLNLWMWTFLD